jgi:hypothetical protein
MYPTMVMVLVHNHGTFDQMYYMASSLPSNNHSASGSHGNFTGPIVFVPPIVTDASSTGTFPEQAEPKGDHQQE